MSTTETENKEVSRSHAEELVGEGNLDVAADHVADDYVWHRPGRDAVHGPDGVKEFVSGFLDTFPDLEVTVEDLIAEDDKVARRDRFAGTHELTGKEVEVEGIVINRIEDGQMVESWGQSDMMGLMKQLGFYVVPGPGLMLRMAIGKVKSLFYG